MNMKQTLRTTALAALLACAGLAQAAAVSGVWRTADDTYLMTVRDTAGVIVGLEVGSDMTVRDAYTGNRTPGNFVLRSVGNAQRQIAIDAVQTTTMTGTRDGVQPFQATRLLSYLDANLNGIWQREDNPNGFVFVFNTEGQDGGTAIVSELVLKDGVFKHLLALGKLTGNTFADTQSGYRLMLGADGRLSVAYGDDDRGVSPVQATSSSAGSAAGGADSGQTKASSGAPTYTATRVVTGKDPEAAKPTLPQPQVPTKPKGCEADAPFLQLQTTIKASLAENMTRTGVSPGWIVSKTQIGETTVFDGGTVPKYRYTYVTDVSANLNKTLKAANQPQNLFIGCTANGSTPLSSTYGATLLAKTYDDNGAVLTNEPTTEAINTAVADLQAQGNAFCAGIKDNMAPLNPVNYAMSARGMNADDILFYSDATTSSGKTSLNAGIFVNTDGAIGYPNADYKVYDLNKKVVSNSKSAYTTLLDSCKTWYESGKTPASTFPAWDGGVPSGGPSFTLCVDPNATSAQTPGVFGVRIFSGDKNAAHSGEPYVKHTTEVDFNTIAPYEFTSYDSNGKKQIMVTRVPIHLPKTVASANDAVPSGTYAQCYYDTEAEKWLGITWNLVGLVVEPHLEVCKGLNPQFLTQFKDSAYKGLYQNKRNIDMPNGQVNYLSAAEALSVGMGLMAGGGLGVLGIGGFEPSPAVSDSLVSLDATSTAKFISVAPYASTGGQPVCYTVPADPSTGEPATKVCDPVPTPGWKQIAYTIEAPSCEK